ncbi:sensor histidine kinase [Nonlabens antarcticus]|uniref:sensor histidine kinase n=1 Tax=Nonlabens antarcticus TaxID=392714 RepID=UPI00189113A9|nr:HAMP domain-containing sensor histidine kinase [Nonlabens antarcticus]
MTYKGYSFSLFLRTLAIVGAAFLLSYGFLKDHLYFSIGGSIVLVIVSINTYKFVTRRFIEMDDFFESVKYRDFSRWFVEDRGSQDIRKLHKGFNLVNATIKSINNERQAQFVYLQKILAMVDVGIIAYNVEDGVVLWANDSFLKLLDFPAFKNISFVESRRPETYEVLFEQYHATVTSTTLHLRQEDIKILISDTLFEVSENSFKLIVVQNIDDTLNHNESEAWKKLLSVMTHEIMNSIAPISSLAETLEQSLLTGIGDEQCNTADYDDLLSGIQSIKRRSEGLMKFAQTYRSLNKVTHINRTEIRAVDLFSSIENLLLPSLTERNISLNFNLADRDLILKIDSYLIEQVLINLILNAIEATEKMTNPEVVVTAKAFSQDKVQITVADNGSGIPDEVLEKIFIPFFSTKKRGSGIGLSLCKQIMTLHQGKIQLRNMESGGVEARLMF